MIIKPLTVSDNSFVVVRYTLNGEYRQAEDFTGNGVEVPDSAELVDIAYYGSKAMTQQIVFLPNWPDALAA